MLRALANRKRSLNYASLEPRRVLATVTLADGLLQITGTDSNDVVSIELDAQAATVDVAQPDSQATTFALQDVDSIWFWGDAGDDQLIISGQMEDGWEGLSQVEFFGGAGADLFDFRITGVTSVDVLANGGEGNDILKAEVSSEASVTNPVKLVGGAGDDTLVGGEADDTLLGGIGNDTLIGNGGNDLVSGGAGWDTLTGNAGDDTLLGGWGNDHLNGGWGDDVLFGGNGDDTMTGSDGMDSIYGGAGDDVSYGGLGNDIINSGDGDDRSFGGRGNDRLVGGAGNDLLNGFTGDDVLLGQAGNDRLFGHSGENLLLGGWGDDTLQGGDGFDRVFGEAGADWLGDSLEDITDFAAGQDRRDVGLDDFLGLTEQAAMDLADSMNRESLIYWRDGENAYCIKGADYVARRLEFSLENGIVIAVRTETQQWAGRFLTRRDFPRYCVVVGPIPF